MGSPRVQTSRVDPGLGAPGERFSAGASGEVPRRSGARGLDESAHVGVHGQRWRLVLDEVLELLSEFLERQASARGELGELVRVVEVITAQAEHVPPGDRVARGVDVDEAHLACARTSDRPAGRTGRARSGRPASRSSRRSRPTEDTWPRSSPGPACTPCRRGPDRRTAARSRCSWRRAWPSAPNDFRRFDTSAFRISPMFTSAMRTWPCASRSTSSSASRSAGSMSSTSPSAMMATPSRRP